MLASFSSEISVECCICGRECDGTLMRTNPCYTRVRDMLLADEVPRTPFRQGIRVCHQCQRAMYFAGGFNQLLLKRLRSETFSAVARGVISKRPPREKQRRERIVPDEYIFEVREGVSKLRSAHGTGPELAAIWREAIHYGIQYAQDGPVTVTIFHKSGRGRRLLAKFTGEAMQAMIGVEIATDP